MVGANGRLVVADPSEALRAAYRRALATVPVDQIEAGKRITYRGRNHGDLVITLVDEPVDDMVLEPVPIPEVPDLSTPVLAHLAGHTELIAVSAQCRERALLIFQALVEEGERRGHVARHRGDEPGVDLVIDGQRLAVTVQEEREKVSQVPDQALAGARFDWQRLSPVDQIQWSGRLVATLHTGEWREPSWADRTRWRLESRLPKLLALAESVANARSDAQTRQRSEQAERRAVWAAAIPVAERAWVDSVNRSRLDEQVEAFSRAASLRAYADAVADRAAVMESAEERRLAVGWADWIRAEAAQVDPTLLRGQLRYITPATLPPAEVSRFMPHQWSVSSPPE